MGQKKSGKCCKLPDSYKGWVSKYNPYTILKKNFTTKKKSLLFFSHTVEKTVNNFDALKRQE